MMNLILGDHYETFIRDQLAHRHFDNVSQVICEGLRLLEEKQAALNPAPDLEARLAALRPAISPVDTRAVFAEVRQQLRQSGRLRA